MPGDETKLNSPYSVEVIPGVKAQITTTGLSEDVFNAWGATGYADIDMFEEITPIETYEQYLTASSLKHQEAGQPGLFDAVMERSNPKAVIEFNKVVAEFNQDLARIKQDKDAMAVRGYLERAMVLKEKLPEENVNTPAL